MTNAVNRREINMTNQTEEQRRIAALEKDVAALKSQLAQVNSRLQVPEGHVEKVRQALDWAASVSAQ